MVPIASLRLAQLGLFIALTVLNWLKNPDIYIEDINKVQDLNIDKYLGLALNFTAVELSIDEAQREQDVFNVVFANLTLSKQPEKYMKLQAVQSENYSKNARFDIIGPI